MKTGPVVEAEVDFSDLAAPRSPAFDDVYHPRGSGSEHAARVFIAGNGLPERWRGRARFTVLETGFGLGNNFLATWAAWREDLARCERLFFVSIEKHPLCPADLARVHAASPAPELSRQLLDAWPPATCNLHTLDFEAGRVRLLLAFGDIAAWARELVASVDAFFLDGFAPAHNPAMWDRGVFKLLSRLAAPGATAAASNAEPAVHEGLRSAGFEPTRAQGGSDGDITLARFAPRFKTPSPPGRLLPDHAPTHALVIGGGIAGALTARALARQGITSTVIDRQAKPAAEASGNPAGLFHGAVMGHDGPHARLLRAAALATEPLMRAALAAGAAGNASGLLRLESRLSLSAMQVLLDRQNLPARYVQAVSAEAASQRAGTPVAQPAWFYPGGGSIDPVALARFALTTEGVSWRGSLDVQRIARIGEVWRVFNAEGKPIAEAPLLVLANAIDALRLAGLPPQWLQRQRGQVSWTADRVAMAPRMPVASGGYALTLADGRLLFGATNQADDTDPAVRESDHRDNRAKLALLLGAAALRDDEALQGRVGWRAATPDRLPLVGPAPDTDAPCPSRADAPRLIARLPGLWLHTGLGSRGLTTAALCAELIAAQVSGAPWPLEADLAEAIDPARGLLRRD